MKKIYIKIFFLLIISFCLFSCGIGKYKYNRLVRKKLKKKYKESFIIKSQGISRYYKGNNVLEQFINFISFKKPEYCTYSYTISPVKNKKIEFFAWLDSRHKSVSDNYFNEKLKYQVKKYVFSIISSEIIHEESLNCYVNFENDIISSYYKKGMFSTADIIAIEKNYNSAGLSITINFKLNIIQKNKKEYSNELYKLYSVLLKNDWRKFTTVSIESSNKSIYLKLDKNISKKEFTNLIVNLIN